MTNELEKQKMERIYKHFGFTGENIESQRQVRTDIYNILTDMGYKAQIPNCVAIDTENGWHKIIGYPFNTTPNHWGQYEHSLFLKIPVKYEFKKLEEFIKHQVRTLFEEG